MTTITQHANMPTLVEQALAERGLGDKPARRVIHIEPTNEQWLTIDLLVSNPRLTANDNGNISLYRIVDDALVELYDIEPNGAYTYESLQGFHQGWTTFDSDDNRVEIED